MRSRISAVALSVLATVCHAAPPDIWPAQIPKLEAAAQPRKFAAIDAAARALPAALAPAVSLQKLTIKIISGAPQSSWIEELKALARKSGDDPITAMARDLARVWLARVEMLEIDGALREYYRHHVSFPDSIAAIEQQLPEGLRVDPWGGKWVYQTKTPKGFTHLQKQRYRLGPSRHPELAALSEAIRDRKPAGNDWTIRAQNPGGKPALEIRSSPAASAVIEPGGTIDHCTLAFIGDGWALMGDLDQLFTVTFALMR